MPENEHSFLYTSSSMKWANCVNVEVDRWNFKWLQCCNYTNIVDGIDLWINPLANPDGAFAAEWSPSYGAVREMLSGLLNKIIQTH